MSVDVALHAPPSVAVAFLEECTVREPSAFTTNDAIYEAYISWCKVTDEHPLDSTVLGRRLAACPDITLGKRNGKRGIFGLRMRAPSEQKPPRPRAMPQSIAMTWEEKVIEWWGETRPSRFTLEDVQSALIPSTMTRVFQAKARDGVRCAVDRLAARRRFADGWFYEPTAKLRDAATPKPVPGTATATTPTPTPTSFVYFVQAVSGGPIKIGVTTDVRARLASLQTGHPSACASSPSSRATSPTSGISTSASRCCASRAASGSSPGAN